MKYLQFFLFLLIVISCKQQPEEIAQQNFDFNAWIEDNRIPQHEKLISVETQEVGGIYTISKSCQIEKNNEPSEVNIEYNNDTIITTYCITQNSNSGRDMYDVSIENDTIRLLYDFVYPPIGTIDILDDVPTVKRKYKILNEDAEFDNKKWVVDYHSLMKK